MSQDPERFVEGALSDLIAKIRMLVLQSTSYPKCPLPFTNWRKCVFILLSKEMFRWALPNVRQKLARHQ